MCDKCAENRELCEQISERMNTAERVREYYRRQGEKREQERIVALLELQSFFWTGDKQTLTLGKDEVIALIKGENK